MAESTLSLKRDDIRKRIALYLGFGLDEDRWDTTKIEQLGLFLSDGLRCFESPVIEKQPYEWSFRKIQGTITTVNTQQAYALPDDFGGVIDRLVMTSQTGSVTITMIPLDALLQKQAKEAPANGPPQYAAIRKLSGAPSTSQSIRWELLVFPTSGATVRTLQYTYPYIPDGVSSTSNTYTSVPAMHVETVVAACLASAERYTNRESQTQQAYFQERLQASVQHDQQVRRSMEETFSFVKPAYGAYNWFARRIGKWAGFGWNYHEWSNPQTEEVNDIIQRGLRRFYFPPPMPRGEGAPPESPHEWSFLSPTGTIAMVTSQGEYELPDGFQGVIGEMAFPLGSGYKSLQKVSFSDHLAMLAGDSTNGVPRYYSVVPKSQTGSANQLAKAALYPPPAVAHNGTSLTYRYKRTPAALATATPYPYGGEAHAETMLAAMRCVWADGGEQEQPAYQGFLQRLAASIQLDKVVEQGTVMPWNVTAPTYGSYDWLLEEVGAVMGVGGNPAAWSHDEERRIDSFIQRGYEIFRMPHLTGDPALSHHRWSFLYTTATLTTVESYDTGTITSTAGVGVELSGGTFPTWAASGEIEIDGVWYEVDTRTDGDTIVLVDTGVTAAAGTEYTLHRMWYSLPSTLQDLDGPLTYAAGNAPYATVEERTEAFLRERRQNEPSTGYARYFAVRPTIAATAGTTWELTAWPNWDGIYVLTYRYKVKPGVLTTGDFPLGGSEHAETVLASCLALVDPRKFREDFMLKLAGSIRMDQREQSPASLGIGYDRSDFSGIGWSHGYDGHTNVYESP